MHPESGLSKAFLTDHDLAGMPWEYCRIHALAVTDDEGPPDDLSPEEFLEQDDLDDTAPSALRLLLDLDYIVRRIVPAPMRDHRFWVAPATLIFHNVLAISGSLSSVSLPLELEGLTREGGDWHLKARDMDLRFAALGHSLVVRKAPRYGARVLRMAERGGITFDTRPFA